MRSDCPTDITVWKVYRVEGVEGIEWWTVTRRSGGVR
jgi:hypothetical protein